MSGHVLPFGPVSEETAVVLTLIDGDPLHARDRSVIVAAILTDADEHGGQVDPNRVRPHLSNVFPRCVGATYYALQRAGVLVLDGWTISEDSRGGNAGKPVRTYRRGWGGHGCRSGT